VTVGEPSSVNHADVNGIARLAVAKEGNAKVAASGGAAQPDTAPRRVGNLGAVLGKSIGVVSQRQPHAFSRVLKELDGVGHCGKANVMLIHTEDVVTDVHKSRLVRNGASSDGSDEDASALVTHVNGPANAEPKGASAVRAVEVHLADQGRLLQLLAALPLAPLLCAFDTRLWQRRRE